MTKRFLVFLPVILLIGLGLYFIFTTSPFVRYLVDDFCSASLLNKIGFWNSQSHWWNNWTGRYSATFLVSVFELAGTWIVRILPIVFLIALIAGLKRFGFFLATVFVSLALFNSPNIIQSFYWQTGAVNYLAPIIFFNLFMGLLIFGNKKTNPIFALPLTLIAGGFSETYTLVQLVILVFALLTILVVGPKDKIQKLKFLAFGALGAVISLVLVLNSPGNAVREAGVTHPESLFYVIKSTLLTSKWYILRLLGIKTFIYSLLVLISSVFLFGQRYVLSVKKAIGVLMLTILAVATSVITVVFSGYYSMSIIPPDRALFIAVYMFLFCFLIFSFAIKSIIGNKRFLKMEKSLFWMALVLNIVSVILLAGSVVPYWTEVRSEVRHYAEDFDKIEPKLLDGKGSQEVEVANIKSAGGLDSFTDNKGWVTSCLSDYYKIGHIKIAK